MLVKMAASAFPIGHNRNWQPGKFVSGCVRRNGSGSGDVPGRSLWRLLQSVAPPTSTMRGTPASPEGGDLTPTNRRGRRLSDLQQSGQNRSKADPTAVVGTNTKARCRSVSQATTALPGRMLLVLENFFYARSGAMIQFVRMSESDFATYAAEVVPAYAADKIASGQ